MFASGNAGKMRRLTDWEWKMGMKEETCWGSTGSYSELHGNFQTMSFLVIKGDFEKHIKDLYNSNSWTEWSWCITARKAEEGRKLHPRDSAIITIINLWRTAYSQKWHYPNINSKMHTSLDFLSLLHLTLSLTHLASLSWPPVPKWETPSSKSHQNNNTNLSPSFPFSELLSHKYVSADPIFPFLVAIMVEAYNSFQ